MIKKLNNKQLALLISLLLVLTVSVGGTLAYIVTQTGAVTNTFKPTEVTCAVEEKPFDGEVKSEVTVKNTGDVDAYIRANIVVTWRDSEGNIAPKTPILGTDYTLSLNFDEGWTIGNDGYYYYKSDVASGASTGVLINNCTAKTADYEDYNLCVEIIADAIQADGVNADGDAAVTTVWPVSVNEDGSLSINQ